MTYSDFHRLRLAVAECSDFDSFVAEVGGSVDCDDVEQLLRQLEAVYKCKTVKDIRALTGLSQVAFSAAYQLPRRTVEDWEAGRRVPPLYVADMLLFAVLSDNG